ncbi:unnamed protein product [Nezara viridula]|uniref:Uncharacterized protein n=1 Tax=Nezara viridula TaxID=85310 RepID=A0A9P0E4L1_NEZVI|nr:unnamed protein product [Nezara viridula]
MAPQSSICEKKGIKTDAKKYQDDILEPVVKPINDTVCFKSLDFPVGFRSS